MAGFNCPFCNQVMSVNDSTRNYFRPTFRSSDYHSPEHTDEAFKITFFLCPNCKEYTVHAHGIGRKTNGISIPLYPKSLAKQFPEYVPLPIRQDYEEAYSIVNLSPKASATLSRRCLQGMIRDYWGISKGTLAAEIDALEDKIPPVQWSVLTGLRKIGNIGAHMEKDINLIVDIDPEEAEKLLKLIELLIEQWYIQRHDQEQLYNDIIGIADAKQAIKNP
jgi:Domain of unknown function (DUF4145)